MSQATILIVDDTPQNVELLEAVLGSRGYRVIVAANGAEALDVVARESPDLVLLDIQMPVMDGYETCRRLRAGAATVALPVVMITAGGDTQKVKVAALESGADDFIAKPFDQAELLARVQSLLRIKRYHDTIQQQAAELAEQRLSRLRRFLSPHLADIVLADEDLLTTHRREIAVLFCDLRGFTAFTARSDPEVVMTALAQYHDALGGLIRRFEATVGDFAGDGVMAYFNDPLPCAEPALTATEMALEIRAAMAGVTAEWRRRGFDLGYGVGIAYGDATIGMIGFEDRVDYAPVGTVVNLASRLCDEARDGETLLDPQAMAAVGAKILTEPTEALTLKGFADPVTAHRLVGRA